MPNLPFRLAHRSRLLAFSGLFLVATAGVTIAAIDDGTVVPALQTPSSVQLQLSPPKFRPVQVPPIAQLGAVTDAMTRLSEQTHCLAEVLYFEARGESEQGEIAIAEVIFHRLAEGQHGHTICAVAYEGSDQTFCQFTFACDGSRDRPKEPEPWRAAQVLAARILAGEIATGNVTEGATFYHSVAVHPTWAPQMQRMVQIGNHIFYRQANRQVVTLRGSSL